MTLHRIRPLPRGALRGRYRVAPNIIRDTQRALTAFDEAGRHEGGHEGICYWAGLEEAGVTTLDAVVVPTASHGKFGVFVSAAGFGEAARRARAMGLGILSQVHSHSGEDTRHSDGDDDLVVMPFEGMLSLVAPHYGRRLNAITDFSIHQFQDHRWILCDPDTISAALEVIDPNHG